MMLYVYSLRKKNKTKMSKSQVVTSAHKLTTTTEISCEHTKVKTQTPANISGLILMLHDASWYVPLLPGSSRQPIFVSFPFTLFIGFFGILYACKLTLVSSWMAEHCKTQLVLAIYSVLHLYQWQIKTSKTPKTDKSILYKTEQQLRPIQLATF